MRRGVPLSFASCLLGVNAIVGEKCFSAPSFVLSCAINRSCVGNSVVFELEEERAWSLSFLSFALAAFGHFVVACPKMLSQNDCATDKTYPSR